MRKEEEEFCGFLVKVAEIAVVENNRATASCLLLGITHLQPPLSVPRRGGGGGCSTQTTTIGGVTQSLSVTVVIVFFFFPRHNTPPLPHPLTIKGRGSQDEFLC